MGEGTARRRDVLRAGVVLGGGLLLGIPLPRPGTASATPDVTADATRELLGTLHIDAGGIVTVYVTRSEMGQGVYTSLPMLVAEELEVEWDSVRVSLPTLDDGERQIATGASTSIRQDWKPLREAGATARELLRQAAAERWNVKIESCHAALGHIIHAPTGRRIGYGPLVEAAAALPRRAPPPLKPREALRILGRDVTRLDVPDKTRGTAVFGIDVVVPDMLHASLRLSPVFGGDYVGGDESAAARVAGVRATVRVPGGVAIVADRFWQAERGLRALAPRFEGGATDFSTEAHQARLRRALDAPGAPIWQRGDPLEAEGRAARVVEQEYSVPFLAHTPMEPMTCTASVTGGGCELWVGTQTPSGARDAAAQALGIPADRIRVNTVLLGGAFGRRIDSDFVVQAVLASRAVGRPVKLIWTREQDVQHDRYRPAYRTRIRGTLDASGRPLSWRQTLAGTPMDGQSAPPWLKSAITWAQRKVDTTLVPEATPNFLKYRFPAWIRHGRDDVAVHGAELVYSIPHQRLDYVMEPSPVPIGWWRSVGHSHNGFFIESFIDELAHAAGRDPYAFRRDALALGPREQQVLDRAAHAAGWGEPLPPGAGRGIALSRAFDTLVCQVAEVHSEPSSSGPSGKFRVRRVVCAVDCGQVVHPDTVRGQLEGAILYGLSAALRGRITVEQGRVVQSNFHDYPAVGFAESPQIEIHLVASDAPPGGIGEAGTPAIAPAVANALFAATGRRVRELPLLDAGS